MQPCVPLCVTVQYIAIQPVFSIATSILRFSCHHYSCHNENRFFHNGDTYSFLTQPLDRRMYLVHWKSDTSNPSSERQKTKTFALEIGRAQLLQHHALGIFIDSTDGTTQSSTYAETWLACVRTSSPIL